MCVSESLDPSLNSLTNPILNCDSLFLLFFDYNQTTIANSIVAALAKSMGKGKFANANHGDKASNTNIPFSGWGQSLQYENGGQATSPPP
jgi:hypothetical protein